MRQKQRQDPPFPSPTKALNRKCWAQPQPVNHLTPGQWSPCCWFKFH